MQNHLEISSKSHFWIRNVEIGGKHKENIFQKHKQQGDDEHLGVPCAKTFGFLRRSEPRRAKASTREYTNDSCQIFIVLEKQK